MLYLFALICFRIQSKSLFTVMLKKHQTPQTLLFQGLSEPFYFSLDSNTTVLTFFEFGNISNNNHFYSHVLPKEFSSISLPWSRMIV